MTRRTRPRRRMAEHLDSQQAARSQMISFWLLPIIMLVFFLSMWDNPFEKLSEDDMALLYIIITEPEYFELDEQAQDRLTALYVEQKGSMEPTELCTYSPLFWWWRFNSLINRHITEKMYKLYAVVIVFCIVLIAGLLSPRPQPAPPRVADRRRRIAQRRRQRRTHHRD